MKYFRFVDPDYARILVAGGGPANTKLWIADSKAKVWTQTADLPYRPGQTVYGATIVEKGGRAFVTGGFRDKVIKLHKRAFFARLFNILGVHRCCQEL